MVYQQAIDHYQKYVDGKVSFLNGRSESYADHSVVVLADNTDILNLTRQIAAVKSGKDDGAFFVMDMGRVNTLVENWKLHMPNVQPFYTMKCNMDPVLLRILTHRNVGLCCSNRAELQMALKYVNRDRLIYSNPLWTRANVRHARENGVRLVVVETEDDMNRFAVNYPESRIILRVVMDPPLEASAFNIGGPDVDQAAKLLYRAADLGVKIVGISVSVRVGAPSSAIFTYSIAQARRLFDIGHKTGHKMSILDVGDGFPGSESVKGASFVQIAEALTKAMDKFFTAESYNKLQVIAEPGSYFAESPYSLVTRVFTKHVVDAQTLTNDQKDSGTIGYIYQISEGFYGAFGCSLMTHSEPKCCPLNNINPMNTSYAAVIGPTLCPNDVVLKLARIPVVKVGDWFIWKDLGAYSVGNSTHSGNGELPVPLIHYFVENSAWSRLSSVASTVILKATSCHDAASDKVEHSDQSFTTNDQIAIKEMV